MMAEVTIMEHRSIAGIREEELVQMLLSDPLGHMDLLGIKAFQVLPSTTRTFFWTAFQAISKAILTFCCVPRIGQTRPLP